MALLAGKVAVVTGGSRGIGAAVAQAMADAGARLCLIGRDGALAAEVAARLPGSIGIGADVARREDVDSALARARSELGEVDILVAAAGVWASLPIAKIGAADMTKMMNVHVQGSLNAIQAALPGMTGRGGRIILVSSLAALQGSSLPAVHYAAAKGAILGLTQAAARELASEQITVNCVVPLAQTQMMARHAATALSVGETVQATQTHAPLGMPQPSDIAALFVFLASDGARRLTGQVIRATGGA